MNTQMRHFVVTASVILATVFAAAPSARADSVVMVAGDIVCPPRLATTPTKCRDEQTSDILLANKPDRVLTAGDNQYDEGKFRHFRNAYHLTWGRLKDITRPTAGNHEYRTEDAKGYFNYFDSRAGKPNKGYYGFKQEDWQLIALNSNIGVRRGSRQVEWLRRKLTTNPSNCTMAYFHHPLYSSGEHGNNPKMKPIYRLLHGAGVELVIAGHDHNYERFAPMNAFGERRSDGVRTIIVGTGGANHRPIANVKPHSRVRNDDTFGVLKLILRLNTYDWEFIPEEGKSFTDSGSDDCH